MYVFDKGEHLAEAKFVFLAGERKYLVACCQPADQQCAATTTANRRHVQGENVRPAEALFKPAEWQCTERL